MNTTFTIQYVILITGKTQQKHSQERMKNKEHMDMIHKKYYLAILLITFLYY